MNYFSKYGIRFGTALFVAIIIQLKNGNWDWIDFIGRSVTTILVVSLSYPLEKWIAAKRIFRGAHPE